MYLFLEFTIADRAGVKNQRNSRELEFPPTKNGR